MARPRWIAPWKDSAEKPAIYHVISRVVDRRRAFGAEEKEKFRTLMRMAENFTGCRVLSYCLMSNHIHLLLEVPPKPTERISEEELLRRLAVFYPTWKVQEQQRRLREAKEAGNLNEVERIFSGYTYRMHDLSEFMKVLLQRFSSWFNRTHQRTGRLWEQRFKSVLVESGFAAQTVAAYIDLNPVRAGICEDPVDYRWSSYAEAVAGVKKARAGLVRVMQEASRVSGDSVRLDANPRAWSHAGFGKRYRLILLGKAEQVVVDGEMKRQGMDPASARAEAELLESGVGTGEMRIAWVIRHRVRYFTDGAVIGGKSFVEEVFRESREYFGTKRKSGARKPRGALGELAGEVWSARDLRVGVG